MFEKCWILHCTFLLGLFFQTTVSREKFAIEPTNQVVKVGEEATIPCRIVNHDGDVQWTRNGFGLGFGRDLEAFLRYKIIGSREEGDWSLRIQDVRLEDEGEFQCQVGGVGHLPPMKSRKGNLTVYLEPDPPEILQISKNGLVRTVSGQELQLFCISRNGKPASTVKWMFGNGTVIIKDVDSRTRERNKLYNTTATLRIQVNKEMDGLKLLCQSENSMDYLPKTTQITLSVEYAPEVQLIFSPMEVREGEDLNISCLSRANPSKVRYSWLFNRRSITDRATGLPLLKPEHTIHSVQRHQHGLVVTCEVSNSRGRTDDSRKISVLYSPRIELSSLNYVKKDGEVISIVCQVSSNPPSDIIWYKLPQYNKPIHRGMNLTLTVNRMTEGKYICSAVSEMFGEVSSREVEVLLKKKPVISNREKYFYGVLGETAHVRCIGEMVPNQGHISWRRKGYRVGTDSDRFTVLEEKFGAEFMSTLVIPEILESDFGTYECSIENEIGRDRAIFQLREEGNLSLMSVFGAIFGVLITILLLVGIAYWRMCGSNLTVRSWKSKAENTKVNCSEVNYNGKLLVNSTENNVECTELSGVQNPLDYNQRNVVQENTADSEFSPLICTQNKRTNPRSVTVNHSISQESDLKKRTTTTTTTATAATDYKCTNNSDTFIGSRHLEAKDLTTALEDFDHVTSGSRMEKRDYISGGGSVVDNNSRGDLDDHSQVLLLRQSSDTDNHSETRCSDHKSTVRLKSEKRNGTVPPALISEPVTDSDTLYGFGDNVTGLTNAVSKVTGNHHGNTNGSLAKHQVTSSSSSAAGPLEVNASRSSRGTNPAKYISTRNSGVQAVGDIQDHSRDQPQPVNFYANSMYVATNHEFDLRNQRECNWMPGLSQPELSDHYGIFSYDPPDIDQDAVYSCRTLDKYNYRNHHSNKDSHRYSYSNSLSSSQRYKSKYNRFTS